MRELCDKPDVPGTTHRVALATCSYFPEGDTDDAGLPEAIGGDVAFAIWDDPAVDWSTFDLVVVRSTWDYQGRRDEFLAWARGIGDRLVNPPEVLAWNTDKRYLRELAEAGLPVVPTALVAPGEAFAAPPAGDGEYVVKPTVSAGSRDTARFGSAGGDADRAAALVDAIHASGRTAMVQPYVASVDERGETALLFFDGAFSHAIHKGPLLRRGADPTTEVFAAETIEPREPSEAELAVAQRVIEHAVARMETGPLAYTRVDLVQDAAGDPLLLELELTEPSLFFAGEPGRLSQFAGAIRRRLPER
ncbi:MAG: ATP-grasp protein [Conexibacter sp.]|nr:ATP-grasp protein [Conexibacter sp.]